MATAPAHLATRRALLLLLHLLLPPMLLALLPLLAPMLLLPLLLLLLLSRLAFTASPAMRRADERDASLRNRAAREGLRLRSNLINNDHLGCVVLHSLNLQQHRQGKRQELFLSLNLATPLFFPLFIQSDIVRFNYKGCESENRSPQASGFQPTVPRG